VSRFAPRAPSLLPKSDQRQLRRKTGIEDKPIPDRGWAYVVLRVHGPAEKNLVQPETGREQKRAFIRRSHALDDRRLYIDCPGLGVDWPAENPWYILAAFTAGTLKSLWILDRTARRAVFRIVSLRDGTCLGAIYSWKTWLLAVIMTTSGILLRTVYNPGAILGTIYLAVGWALLFSSRFGWLEWSRWIKK
jgi:hypothetical protein